MTGTIDALLAERAGEHPDAEFLRFTGSVLTFAETQSRVAAAAAGFSALGVRAGDHVPVLMGNRVEMVVTWFALARLGAAAVLLNTAFRGPALVHALTNALAVAGTDLMVVEDTLVPSVAGVVDDVPVLRRIVAVGDAAGATTRFRHHEVLAWADLTATEPAPAPAPMHHWSDPAMVIFTSGTTGRSKGCVLSHRYAVRQAELMVEHLGLRRDDVLYCPFPLFHIDAAVLTVMPALVLGTTAVIAERFSASRFWDDVRTHGVTVFDFMGATLTMLYKQPQSPDDADNPARLAWGVPVPEFADTFEARFGLRLVELYGSTDAGIPMYQPLDEPRRSGTCGRAISAYDVDLFDGEDRPVATGDVGEIVVRPREPSLMADGYLGMPEATLASRRNLWFHTGDLARRDADGHFSFVGRRSDSIRRRGENISAFELEEVVKLHPAVLDAAAFGVPSELTEDDVMVAVVARPGAVVDPADLAAFCADRLARHMVPRYVDVVDSLPRTPTEKVEKAVLRERGVTATTWDGDTARR